MGGGLQARDHIRRLPRPHPGVGQALEPLGVVDAGAVLATGRRRRGVLFLRVFHLVLQLLLLVVMVVLVLLLLLLDRMDALDVVVVVLVELVVVVVEVVVDDGVGLS